MHFTLSALLAVATATASVAAKGYPTSENPYPNPSIQLQKREDQSLVKRTFDSNGCFLGILCFGTSQADYSSDPNNCGRKNNRCSSTWPGGNGAKCSNGVCGASQCNYNLWDFNWLNFRCQDVSADTNNCGRCGQTCTTASVPNSRAVQCVSGTCAATQCNNGYSVVGGACVSCPTGFAYNGASKKCQDVRSDMNNCGAINSVCSIPRGNGKCQNGQCLVDTCRSGCHNLGDNQCTEIDVENDSKNCGSIKNDCSGKYPNGVGGCKNGQCYLKDCNDNFKAQSSNNCWLWWCDAPTETCTAIDMNTDVDNCGARGKKCPPSDPFGDNMRCQNKQCFADCKKGYTWDQGYTMCRRTDNDISNCGGIGNKCSSDKGTPMCKDSECSYSQCKNGFIKTDDDDCIQTDTTTDVNNCGRAGNRCKASDFPGASGAQCVASTCRGVCPDKFDWDPLTKRCRDVQSDNDHCGRCNTPCSIPNAKAQCQNGQCTLIKCNDNYENILGKCVYQDSNTNVNGCGPSRTKCSFPLGAGICSAGKCTYTSCSKPYSLTDSGTCTMINTDTDPNNCGKQGKKCGPYPNSLTPNALGQCSNGKCSTACKSLYDWDDDEEYCRPVDKDPNHCGACGRKCQVDGAQSTECRLGKCYATWCLAGYTLTPQGTCTKPTPSQKARAQKKSKIIAPKSLCPNQETACPIAGSASFASALTHHFSAFADVTTGMEGDAGGYECLDTKTSLDSCGGCASTGEGQDCTKIRGAVGVTCADSACVVLSCEAGWRPNLASTKCIRAHHDSHNATRAHGSRRHLSARHGHHS